MFSAGSVKAQSNHRFVWNGAGNRHFAENKKGMAKRKLLGHTSNKKRTADHCPPQICVIFKKKNQVFFIITLSTTLATSSHASQQRSRRLKISVQVKISIASEGLEYSE